MIEEDMHFLIDNAPPIEVEYTLGCINHDSPISTKDLRKSVYSKWEYSVQRNFTLTTRRLYDLGLTNKTRTASGKPGHALTTLGEMLRDILYIDKILYNEIMHYLHHTKYDGSSDSRKLFWSYRTCCDIFWERKQLPPAPEVVAEVQSKIAVQFPSAYAKQVGGNFNTGGVSSGWKPWITRLQPSPLSLEEEKLSPRKTDCFEISLLALDHLYRHQGYRYGDPVILDEKILDDLSRIFFLDPLCCRELLDIAASVTKVVTLSDTFAGTSITLIKPYTIENI